MKSHPKNRGRKARRRVRPRGLFLDPHMRNLEERLAVISREAGLLRLQIRRAKSKASMRAKRSNPAFLKKEWVAKAKAIKTRTTVQPTF